MRALRSFQQLFLTAFLATVVSPASGSQWIAPDFGGLSGENTWVAPGGGLAISEVEALDPSGYWYRHPWGYGVWDVQLAKSGPANGFTGSEGCLRVADNPWAAEALHAFNGRLMRAGPHTSGVSVATLANGTVLPVPDFAARPVSLRFLTFGSHGGASPYSVTLNYASGGPVTVLVPIASASVHPRDASGSDWSTQEVSDFVTLCTGQYGDIVAIPNPRPTADLSSVAFAFDGVFLTGPIAVSLSLSEMDYMAGYLFMGSAWSGSNQATALRALEGLVTWQGLDWSATVPDDWSGINVRMYCGEAGTGGSVLWQYAGEFTLAPGSGSADLVQPCAGEFVRCEVDMVAGLAASPVLDSLCFRYAGAAGVEDGPRAPCVRLEASGPNPFRSTTALRFEIGAAAHVRLAVYDVSGRLIRTLVAADLQPGVHGASWDGRDDDGRRMEPGSYVARLVVGGSSAATWLSLIR